MPRRKKLKPEHVGEIRKLWRNNYKDVQIFRKLKVGKTAYYEFLKANDMSRWSTVDDDEMIDLINLLQRGSKQTWGRGMVKSALNQDHDSMYCNYMIAQQNKSHLTLCLCTITQSG